MTKLVKQFKELSEALKEEQLDKEAIASVIDYLRPTSVEVDAFDHIIEASSLISESVSLEGSPFARVAALEKATGENTAMRLTHSVWAASSWP